MRSGPQDALARTARIQNKLEVLHDRSRRWRRCWGPRIRCTTVDCAKAIVSRARSITSDSTARSSGDWPSTTTFARWIGSESGAIEA
jgi:hypothetical protein